MFAHNLAAMIYSAPASPARMSRCAPVSRDRGIARVSIARVMRLFIFCFLALTMTVASAPFPVSHAFAGHESATHVDGAAVIGHSSDHSKDTQGPSDQHCVLCFSVQLLIAKPQLPTRSHAMAPVTYTRWEQLDGPLGGPPPLFKPPRAI